MKPQQRALLWATADATAEGADLWRSVGDMMADMARGLLKARGELPDGTGQLAGQLAEMAASLKTLASTCDLTADRWSEIAARLQPYRRGGR